MWEVGAVDGGRERGWRRWMVDGGGRGGRGDTWREGIGWRGRVMVVEEDGGGLVGDVEGLEGGEGDEGGAGEAEGATVVGVGGGQVVARVDGVFHEAAPLLAPPHRVLVVQFRRRAAHNLRHC